MHLVLNEDQKLIEQTANDFCAKYMAVGRLRSLRDNGDPTGYSRELWSQMAELGWLGIPYSEEFGGAGLGLAELAVVLEALGRSLAPEPFLSTVLLGGHSLLLGEHAVARAEWLPKIAAGEAIVALAFQEDWSRHDLHCVRTRAEPDGESWKLTGEKVQVLDGHVADAFVVCARTGGSDREREGLTLFLLSPRAPGVSVERQSRIDMRNAARLRFADTPIAGTCRLTAVGTGAALLETVVERATVGLCAEMLGAMSQAFEMTLNYLKTREQFGVKIASFQALKHRAADMFIEIELARSTVMAAAQALDDGHGDASQLVCLAKARCSDAFLSIAHEAVQLHGGIGMTDEHDIGFYLKRARAAEMTFGDSAYHRGRWADLRGY